MADLTILTPTRGRIGNATRLLKAFRDTCTSDTELVFVISADDPDHDLYYWHLTQAGGRAITVHPDRVGVVDPLNAGFEALRASLGYAVGYLGDDHYPRTRGWDSELLSDLRRMRTGVAYGNDLIQGEEMATAVVMTTDIPKALGYLAPPDLAHYCIDVVWVDWGKAIDRLCYRDDVIIEHLHPSAGKARRDASYNATTTLLAADKDTYDTYVTSRLSEDVKKLSALTKPPRKAPAKKATPRKAAPKAVDDER